MARRVAVLFDLDGTLVDTVPFILAGVRHAFEGRALAPTDADWLAGIGTPLRHQLAPFARDAADVELLFQRYRTFRLAEHDRRTRLFEGAEALVRGLAGKGHPLAIITAKIEAGAERTLRHVGLRACFGAVVAADTVERCKPDPLPVQHALRLLDRTPAEAVMIGDSPHDLAAGRGAGTRTAGVLWGAADRATLAPLADDLVAGLPDLLAVVEALQAGLDARSPG